MFSCINEDSIECPSYYNSAIDDNTISDLNNKIDPSIRNLTGHTDKFKFIIIFDYVYQEKIDDVQLVFEEMLDNTKNDEPVPHAKVNI